MTLNQQVIHLIVWACSTYGRQEKRIQGFGGGNLRERDPLEDVGVDGRIILRWIFRK